MILTLALAFVAGILLVRYLTVSVQEMRLSLGLALLSFLLLLAALARSILEGGALLAVPSSLALFLAGFMAMSRRVLSRKDRGDLPALTRSPDDPGLGHAAVIYFAHGEPEVYDPIGWINQFREFDEDQIPFVPRPLRPFFLYRLRQKYLHTGGSRHRQMHQRMMECLERAFREEGDLTTRFYLSFLDDRPRPDQAVVRALNDGASRIIVSEVFLTISNHTAEGREIIRAVLPEGHIVPLHFTGPLWDSRTLHSMFLERANQVLGSADRSRAGVLLVGHGQPDQWDRIFPTETEQELAFRQEILELFVEDGYPRENLALAWMEFKEPRPARAVEEMVRRGVKRVLYFSAAISADSIHSQFDVPELVSKARIPGEVILENVGAWNDHPLAIKAIKEKIDSILV
ncbi:MAG: hypothetical protein GKC10_02135 [Methanosarcinales archaeon]|nr:hypothetical protein [Methanosarcinales archaeon]